jgi:hypothetical protein
VEEKFQDVGWEETIVEKKDVAKPHFYKKFKGRRGKIIVFQQLFFCEIRMLSLNLSLLS